MSNSTLPKSARPLLRSLATAAVAAGVISLLPGTADAQLFQMKRLTKGVNDSPTVVIETQTHLPLDFDFAPGNDQFYFISQLGGIANDGSDGDDVTKADGRIVLYDRATGEVDYNNPFLAISDTSLVDPVFGVPEVGLYGMAFHPDFATNGKFYVSVCVNYPNGAPSLQPRDPRTPPFKLSIREYTADPANITAGATFSKVIFEVDQPSFNHNGSWLDFNQFDVAGGNNYLYVSIGDGGDQHDPFQYGQDKDSLLSTIVRIDIDGDDFPADNSRNYAVPADNPFVGGAGDDAVWAYGLRNPYRCSFDYLTGDLYIGDVGQNTWEEINVMAYGLAPSADRNFGWRPREGFVATPSGGIGGARPADNVDPLIAIRHGNANFQGNSICGGIVYRGPIPEFKGMYIFADSVSGNIWGIDLDDLASFDPANPSATLTRLNDQFVSDDGTPFIAIVGIMEDEDRNLVLIDNGYNGGGIGGNVFRLESTRKIGDANGDGNVDLSDFVILRNNFGASGDVDVTTGDFNNDGTVDLQDFVLLRNNFGN